MDISTINSDLIRGNVTTIILKALYDGTSYGYDILKLIEEKTNGKYVIKQPTLYSCLKRLEKQNLINSYMGTGDDTSGARRRYYTLTDLGKEYLLTQQAEYEYSRTILDKLLSDKEFDLSCDATPFDINELRPYTKVNLDTEANNAEKVVEKTVYVEKPVYIDREVEKIIYVDKPVEVEKIVYVDRNNKPQKSEDVQVRVHSGILVNDRITAPAPQQSVEPTRPAVSQPKNNVAPNIVNQPSGIIVNNINRNQEVNTSSKLPQAPLINRMHDTLKSNDKEQNLLNKAIRQESDGAPKNRMEAQDRATRILGIGKYRQDKVITPGEDDSPSGPNR